jgi:hypothetical protein
MLLRIIYCDWVCLFPCKHTRELSYNIECFLLEKDSWNTFNGRTVFYNWINRNVRIIVLPYLVRWILLFVVKVLFCFHWRSWLC